MSNNMQQFNQSASVKQSASLLSSITEFAEPSIIRSPHDKKNPYFMMLREVAQNRSLTFEARGVIAYLLSKPDDWEIQLSDLRQLCGKDRIQAIVKELVTAGHLSLEPKRDPKTGRMQGRQYQFREKPSSPTAGPTVRRSVVTDSRVFRQSENPHLHNIENTHNTESISATALQERRNALANELDNLPKSKALEAHKAIEQAKVRLSVGGKTSKPVISSLKKNPFSPSRQQAIIPAPLSSLPKTKKPTPPKKPRPRDLIYDALQEHFFKGNGTGGHISHVKAFILKETPKEQHTSLPEDLRLMRAWFEAKYPGAELRSEHKIVERLRDWRAALLAAPLPAHDPHCPLCGGSGKIHHVGKRELGIDDSYEKCPGVQNESSRRL